MLSKPRYSHKSTCSTLHFLSLSLFLFCSVNVEYVFKDLRGFSLCDSSLILSTRNLIHFAAQRKKKPGGSFTMTLAILNFQSYLAKTYCISECVIYISECVFHVCIRIKCFPFYSCLVLLYYQGRRSVYRGARFSLRWVWCVLKKLVARAKCCSRNSKHS